MVSIELIALCTGLALSAMILAGIALAMACVVWSKVVGMEKSTHQVQFVPMETPDGKPVEGDILDEQMSKAMGTGQLENEYI